MDIARFSPIAQVIIDRLAAGLAQDADTLHCLDATLGPLSAQDLITRLADPEDLEAAPLRELLLFPGPDTALALEPALADADLDTSGEADLIRQLGNTVRHIPVRSADRPTFALEVTPQEIAIFVHRLRPTHTAPHPIRESLARRFPPETVLELAVACRHSDLEWSRPQQSFLLALLGRLAPETGDVPDTVRFALRFLAGLPSEQAPLTALPRYRERLATHLHRATLQEQALAHSNFETLILTGSRLPYLHAPDIARELRLADAVLLALTGHTGTSTAATDRDLGTVTDAEALLRTLEKIDD